ncbi:MAG: proprotein convertase P-domain-containing protein [Bacteroidetes bacterium]|nr:proprotein convertase P-domain-containing protein [Bacteroidota bacterium]
MKKSLINIIIVINLFAFIGCGQQNDNASSDVIGQDVSAVSIPTYDQVEIKDLETVVSPIEVEDNVPISIIKVIAVIGHEKTGDLQVRLIAPNGQSHILRDRNEYNKDENLTYLDLNEDVSNKFHSFDYRGTWNLEITDMEEGNEGYLLEWKIEFYNSECYGYGCDSDYIADDNYYGDSSSDYNTPYNSSNNSSSSSPCNGVCTYGATCSDFCPSLAYCTGSYDNNNNLTWTITSCGNNGW